MYRLMLVFLLLSFTTQKNIEEPSSWIRINQLGYTPTGVKVAVWCSKKSQTVTSWQIVDASTKKVVSTGPAGKPFGRYGPFEQTYRIDFSGFTRSGRYYLQVGTTKSPEFNIDYDVYKGAADFCLRYLRQQRTGFNPYLKDSCHTQDGYTLYAGKAGIPDSTYIDVVGGWHDASDYLQYSTTSANTIYHLMAAYRDFPQVFTDEKQANGLDGKNGLADVMDEAKWGLDWLLKMFPNSSTMFNQIADDRDHMGMRMPGMDTFYGRGYERPVYFISGEPQQRGKYMNNTTGTSSTAAKFSSVFSLAHHLLQKDAAFRKMDKRGSYYDKAFEAWDYALKKPGVTQTASVRSPYIYAEDNWVDDMELAAASIHTMLADQNKGAGNGWYMVQAVEYARKEPVTPWLGDDTAKHYQWYPFINLGHYELAKHLKRKENGPKTGYTPGFSTEIWNKADTVIGYYRSGIQAVWNKAKTNAFYRGVPFIWCSNNLTASFAIQCYWYRELTGDKTFSALEQANFDWLFGCNPWGTSMVYGLPSWGDTPVDPHSAFTHIKNYPIDGGLVDGPVYTSIYKNLIGIKLYQPDEYETFQSDLSVYHDDYGDYSTNEPTMDGTASLIYLLAAKEAESVPSNRSSKVKPKPASSNLTYSRGAIIRGDSTKKNIALVFTGHEFAEGGSFIANELKRQKVKASFFFTGDFYYEPKYDRIVKELARDGHFLGNHSMKHMLYCDWNKRDSLLVTREEFWSDLISLNERLGHLADIYDNNGSLGGALFYFLPPYEWYNDTISVWTKEAGMQIINYTPGTISHADYTTPDMKNYRSSEEIYKSIVNYERSKPSGLNGFMLLMHIGAGLKRADKFYERLPDLLKYLKAKGYHFQTVPKLLNVHK